jgi:hypothetical protein
MRILDGICYTVREVTAKFVVITRTLQYQSCVSSSVPKRPGRPPGFLAACRPGPARPLV